MDNPLISIITVNFNGFEDTATLLGDLAEVQYSPVEVWIVDNGSMQEAPWESLQSQYPQFNFVFSKDNLGFAGGNNLAARKATGKYHFYINNDTRVTPDFLHPLVEQAEAHEDFGMSSPVLVYEKPENLVQYAGAPDLNPLTMRNPSDRYQTPDPKVYDFIEPTGFIHGAAMLVSAKAIAQCGLMDDRFFLYYEEYDWCQRIKDAGYSIWFVGKSKVIHKESAAVGANSPLKWYYMTRNRLFFIRKNYRGMTKVSSALFTCLVAIPKDLLKETLSGRFKSLSAILKGATWHITHSVK